ncbi:MAG: glutamate--tRNA ligase [Legionellales bacterium]|nr:glutamate--tRNA ligase [Legionellales bacterium]
MQESQIKFRFSPSPTGLMHLGNTRTALFNDLYAHKLNGIFMLRIEDTDKTRSTDEFTQQLQQDLLWLDLKWQEGPNADKGNGPYWQSQRQGIYDKYYQLLEEQKLTYPCFCSEAQLAINRKVQLASGKPPRYAGVCRHLTAEEIAQKRAQGMVPTLRFHVPVDRTVEFTDFIKGPQRFSTNDLGDFIIRRADGTAPFMYCNAIDDATMGVSHVMRGEDHLTNTPRQILILRALNLPVPQYGHLSLIVGNDDSPLSKRHGSRSVYELRNEGFFPLGLINYLARLGHSYEKNGLMSFDQLAENFNSERLSRSPARFDADQLLYWQKEAVAAADDESLWNWMGIEVHSIVPAEKHSLFIDTIRPNVCFPEDALRWANLIFDEHLTYTPENKLVLQETGAAFFHEAIYAVDTYGADFTAMAEHIKQKLGVKGKALFQPLRIALSNETHGPEMSKIVTLLGAEWVIKRLRAAVF